jgi:hypothetical protein
MYDVCTILVLNLFRTHTYEIQNWNQAFQVFVAYVLPITLIVMFLGSKVRRGRKADNVTAICEPIV